VPDSSDNLANKATLDAAFLERITTGEIDTRRHRAKQLALLDAIRLKPPSEQIDHALDILISKGGDPASLPQDAGLVLVTLILRALKDDLS
jgi:hypothetical protein